MSPFNITQAEEFMRENNIHTMLIRIGESEYHCRILKSGVFEWHAHRGNHD